MAKVKREVIIDIKELCLLLPDQPCRQVLINAIFDPGIGAMIVDPNDPAYFRVR